MSIDARIYTSTTDDPFGYFTQEHMKKEHDKLNFQKGDLFVEINLKNKLFEEGPHDSKDEDYMKLIHVKSGTLHLRHKNLSNNLVLYQNQLTDAEKASIAKILSEYEH